jgi:histidyl-tRNA synthetase
MFRYERMQRGRYRQFSQIGIEVLGAAGPEADVEVILALHTFLVELGFDDLVIVLNNLGDPEDRERFIAGFRAELEARRDELCGDCQRRWSTNPLRILDCKVPRCRELVATTTAIETIANQDARQHVDAVERGLGDLGVAVRRAPRLVRGIDYYVRTVFEVISPELGEDTVICGGGRYDRLLADLGGAEVPGIGFAIGEDRLIEVLPESFRSRVLERPCVAVLMIGRDTAAAGLTVTRELALRSVAAPAEITGRSLRAGLKWAGKIGARAVVILGDDELAAGTVVVRDLARSDQQTVPRSEVVEHILSLLDTE